MKKILISVLLLVFASMAFAQSASQPKKLTPEQMKANWRLIINDSITKEKQKMAVDLSLSDKQIKKADALIAKLLKENDAKLDSFIDTMVSYQQEKQKNPESKKTKDLEEKLSVKANDAMAIYKEFKTDFRTILNKSQQAKLDKIVAQKDAQLKGEVNNIKSPKQTTKKLAKK